jgi:hypothetical protein
MTLCRLFFKTVSAMAALWCQPMQTERAIRRHIRRVEVKTLNLQLRKNMNHHKRLPIYLKIALVLLPATLIFAAFQGKTVTELLQTQKAFATTPTATATATATPQSTVIMNYPLPHEDSLQYYNAPFSRQAPGMYAIVASSPGAAGTPSIALTPTPPIIGNTIFVWGIVSSCVGGSAAATDVIAGLNQNTNWTVELTAGNPPVFIPLFGIPASGINQPVSSTITGGSGATGCTTAIIYWQG